MSNTKRYNDHEWKNMILTYDKDKLSELIKDDAIIKPGNLLLIAIDNRKADVVDLLIDFYQDRFENKSGIYNIYLKEAYMRTLYTEFTIYGSNDDMVPKKICTIYKPNVLNCLQYLFEYVRSPQMLDYRFHDLIGDKRYNCVSKFDIKHDASLERKQALLSLLCLELSHINIFYIKRHYELISELLIPIFVSEDGHTNDEILEIYCTKEIADRICEDTNGLISYSFIASTASIPNTRFIIDPFRNVNDDLSNIKVINGKIILSQKRR